MDAQQAALRAEYEMRRRIGQAQRARVTVQNWTQPDGTLWRAGDTVPITAPWLGVDFSLVIAAVEFLKDDGGTRTELELTLSDAFLPTAEATAAAAKPASGDDMDTKAAFWKSALQTAPYLRGRARRSRAREDQRPDPDDQRDQDRHDEEADDGIGARLLCRCERLLHVALVSQREYARRRGLSQEAVRKRTVALGGPIPTHGPAKRIDETEADALWEATMAPNGYATSRFRSPAAPGALPAKPAPADAPSRIAVGNATALWQARTAMLLTEAQLKHLQLEERRGLVINRQTALAKAFGFARLFRDAWQAWPVHVGPLLAAQFDLDATAVTVALDEFVREHLEQLARERVEF